MHEQTLQRASRQQTPKRPATSPQVTQPPESVPPLEIDALPVSKLRSIGRPSTCKVGVAAITENMLKRKWSATILRHMSSGVHDPLEITKLAPGLSPKVISERLRAMHRYALVTRFPRPTGIIEYRVTIRGKKILEILDTISAVEEQLDHALSDDYSATRS